MNKVILVGNLTRDPELKKTSNDVSVCNFGLAVNRDYVNNDGSRDCDFFNVTAWRGIGENCSKYLSKGNKVCVVGTIETRTFEDNGGITRYVTDIIAQEVEFLTAKSNNNSIPGEEREQKKVNNKKPNEVVGPGEDSN